MSRAAKLDLPRNASGSMPAMALSVVVLPAPLEPSSATTLPSRHFKRHVGDADQVAVAHLEMLDLEQRRGHVEAAHELDCVWPARPLRRLPR